MKFEFFLRTFKDGNSVVYGAMIRFDEPEKIIRRGFRSREIVPAKKTDWTLSLVQSSSPSFIRALLEEFGGKLVPYVWDPNIGLHGGAHRDTRTEKGQ